MKEEFRYFRNSFLPIFFILDFNKRDNDKSKSHVVCLNFSKIVFEQKLAWERYFDSLKFSIRRIIQFG